MVSVASTQELGFRPRNDCHGQRNIKLFFTRSLAGIRTPLIDLDPNTTNSTFNLRSGVSDVSLTSCALEYFSLVPVFVTRGQTDFRLCILMLTFTMLIFRLFKHGLWRFTESHKNKKL